ncbi:hypothetical protein C8P68_103392 [Mucilaginibacter yixingensis]|uniref:YhhN-like protein n=1 Tax=Mucilaginibacter yixingensis TaxID=1295612 RepID=A0A2T5JBI5_9SPHI|nr:hypothetical protein [Mucilaginibacter yixingensis]PTQ98231.1 hypothetical protein C8P68_103392 [Mucilaginibacter yixingensis]
MWLYDSFTYVAFITGLIACCYYRPFYFRLIVILLGITLFNEQVFTVYLIGRLHIHLNIAYNLFSLIDMGIWCYIFFRIYAGRRVQKLILPLTVVIFAYSFVELCFFKGWHVLHVDSFRVYESFIILLAIIYLYEILKKEYYNLTVDPVFWMCAACILYHSILILTFTLRLDAEYWHFTDAKKVFFFLQLITDASYYLLLCCMFISGIILSRRESSFRKL